MVDTSTVLVLVLLCLACRHLALQCDHFLKRRLSSARPTGGPTFCGAFALFGCAFWGLWLLFASPPASADVGADGSFTTASDIQVPSYHGLQPDLALDYSSNGPNGPFGLGWSMAAASTIQRVANLVGVAHWDASDQYVLDGGRLIACAGGSSTVQASPSCAQAVPGTVAYTTETEMYLRIAFDPSANVWRIWRPNGVVVTYHAVLSTSRGTSEWGVSTATDRSGNTVAYHWTHDAGKEPVLSDISYADVQIAFGYEPRPDPLTYAIGDGTAVTNTTRLNKITESTGDTRGTAQDLRSYQLTYAAGAGPSVLHSVQLVGGDGTTSLPATTFTSRTPGSTWTPGQAEDLASQGTAGGRSPRPEYAVTLTGGQQDTFAASQKHWLSLDANGDGRDDLVWVATVSGKTTIGADLSEDGGRNYAADDITVDSPATSSNQVATAVGDVNGDGQDDIVLTVGSPTPPGAPPAIWVTVLYGQPSGQFTQSRGGANHGGVLVPGSTPLVGDVNGDGHADLIAHIPAPACNGNGGLEAYLDDGNSLRPFGPLSCWPTKVNPGSEQIVDVDGDGRADVAAFAPPVHTDSYTSPSPNAQIKVALATSRGLFDMHVDDTGQPWTLQDSQTIEGAHCPSSSQGNTPETNDESKSTTYTTHSYPEWSDMNGDGRTDVILVGPGGAQKNHEALAHVFLSRGDGTFAPERSWSSGLGDAALTAVSKYDCYNTLSVQEPQDLLVEDVNGDGVPDLVLIANDINSDGGEQLGPATVRDGDAGDHAFETPQVLTSDKWSVPCTSTTTCALAPLTMLADFNGDGSPDLAAIIPEGQSTPQSTLQVVPGSPGPGSEPTLHLGSEPTLRADVNGDGLPDLVLVSQLETEHLAMTVWLRTGTGYRPGGVSVVDLPPDERQYWNLGRWLVADLNGDHLDDLVNIPPGGRTALVLQAGDTQKFVCELGADGHQRCAWEHRTDWQPEALTLQQLDSSRVVTRPGHRVCELGPNGHPFCYTEGGSTETVPVYAHWPTSGRWQVADVNGDGAADLVHVGFGDGETTVGPGVLTVFGGSNGNLAPEWRPVPGTDQSHWIATDVDGDGLSDLVHVSDGHITTLLRRGALWVTVAQQVPTVATVPAAQAPPDNDLYVDGGQDAWAPAHLTNGSTTDLVRVLNDPGLPRILIETLTSLGDGTWSPSTQRIDLPTDGTPTAWQPIDLNADGHTDLLGLLPGADSGLHIVELISSDKGWTASSSDATAPAAGYSRWLADTDVGQPEISSMPVGKVFLNTAVSGGTVAVLTQAGGEPAITRTDNGLGATTTVTYSSGTSVTSGDGSPNAECRVPTGSVPQQVVTALATRITGSGTDAQSTFKVPARLAGAPTTLSAIAERQLGDGARWTQIWHANRGRNEPGGARLVNPNVIVPGSTIVIPHTAPTVGGDVIDQSSFEYTCPHYSNALHHFLAFAGTTTQHKPSGTQAPGTTENILRQIDDGGLDQVVLDQTRLAAGDDPKLAVTTTDYEPVGPIPYHNLVKSTTSGTCDPNLDADGQRCAWNTTTIDSRDTFGNPTRVTDRAAGSGRTKITRTEYLDDTMQWLHGLPHQVQVTDPADPTFIRKTLTCYDGDTSQACDHPPENARGLPTLTRQWDGTDWIKTSSRLYDACGNLIEVTTPGSIPHTSNTTGTTFDPQLHLFPIKVTNALGQITQSPMPWDRRAEAPLKTIAVNGGITRTRYDALGRPNQIIGPTRVNSKTTYETGPEGTTTTVTTSSAEGTTWTRTVTDGLGHVYRTETPNARGRVVSADTTYLNATLVGARTAPHQAAHDPTAYTTYRYDGLGRVVAATNADRTQATTTRAIRADGLLSTTSTDEAGRWSTSVTDGWGAQLQLEVPSVQHAGTAATTTTYDVVGDPLTVTDPHGNVLTDTWNPLGQQTSQDDPDSGLTTYHYDPAGNVHQTVDARGRELTYTYDALNRKRTRTDVATGVVASWRYDEGGGANVGQVTRVTDPSAEGCPGSTSHRYTYDVLGDVLTADGCTLGVASTTTSNFDDLGRIKALHYPDSQTVSYAYNTVGELTSVSGFVDNIVYDDSGRSTTIKNANHTIATTTYDPARGWLRSQSLAGDSSPSQPAIFDQTTKYGPTGLVRTTSSASTGQATTDTYNSLGELKTSTDSLQPGPADKLTYDDLGNLVTRSTSGTYSYPRHRACTRPSALKPPPGSPHSDQAPLTCTGPHAARSIGKTTFTYDAAGNTISRNDSSTTRYSWTSEGQLAQIKTAGSRDVTNTYDADGTLVATTVGNKTQVYAGTAERTNGRWLNRIYAAGTLIGELTPKRPGQSQQPEKARRHWLQTDRSGSVRVITGYKGRRIGSVDYTDWGQQEHATGITPDLTLGGHHPDANLIALGARMYDASTGRMLSPDSIIPGPGPLGLNRYAYAYNAPTTYIDPSGHKPIDPMERGHGIDWSWFMNGAPIGGYTPAWAQGPLLNFGNCVTISCLGTWWHNQQTQSTGSQTPVAPAASTAPAGPSTSTSSGGGNQILLAQNERDAGTTATDATLDYLLDTPSSPPYAATTGATPQNLGDFAALPPDKRKDLLAAEGIDMTGVDDPTSLSPPPLTRQQLEAQNLQFEEQAFLATWNVIGLTLPSGFTQEIGTAGMGLAGNTAMGVLERIGTSFSPSEEFAAEELAKQGLNVVLREAPAGGTRGVNTSDLIVEGVQYDVITPEASTPIKNILNSAAAKWTQVNGGGVVIDLTKTGLQPEAFGGTATALARINGFIKSWGGTPLYNVRFVGF